MPTRLSRARRAAVLLLALGASLIAVLWLMLQQLPGLQDAGTVINTVNDAQEVQLQIHDLQQQRGMAVLRRAAAGDTPRATEFENYTDRIALLSNRITGLHRVGDPVLREELRALEKLGQFKEAVAQQRGLLSGVFASGGFTPQEYSRFVATRAVQEDRLTDFERLATNDQRTRLRAVLDSRAAAEAGRLERAADSGAGGRLPQPVDHTAWWTVMTAMIDDLRATQLAIAEDITLQADNARRGHLRDLVLCLLLGIAGIGAQIVLYARLSRTRQSGAAAAVVAEIGPSLVGGSESEDVWDVLARHVAERFAAQVLILRVGEGANRLERWARSGSEELEGLLPAIAASRVADVVATAAPLVMNSLSDHISVPDRRLGPAVAVPVHMGTRVLGVLLAVRDRHATRFTRSDVDGLISLTYHAAVAVEVAEVQQAQRWSAVLDDRARIARGLHHEVIYRLVGMGMALQGVLCLITQARVRDRVTTVINQLDDAVLRLRATAFDLHQPESESCLRQRLLDVLAELARGTGIALMTSVTPSVDTLTRPELIRETEEVVRAIVGNVVQHGQATELALTIEMNDVLSIEVKATGADLSEPTAIDLEQRAAKLGGVLSTDTGPLDDTRVIWQVPLQPDVTTGH